MDSGLTSCDVQEAPNDAAYESWAWRALEDLARKALDAFVCATPHIARSFPRRRTFLVRNYPLLAEFSPARPSTSRTHEQKIARAPGIRQEHQNLILISLRPWRDPGALAILFVRGWCSPL